MPGPPTAVPAWTPGKQVREEVSEAMGPIGRKTGKPWKTSMFFHHFLSCFLMFGGSSVSSKWQMQQRYFDTWVFPRMAFQTPHHRIPVPGGETPKARQKEGIWWLLVG